MKRTPFLVIGVFSLVFGFALAFLPRPLVAVEDQVTSWKYALRGTLQPDTNLILIYVDENAVKALGWPVRRNFYALLMKSLSDLHARVIGVETVFEDQNLEYPEYDELLSNMAGASGRVVVTAYFGEVGSTVRGGAKDSLLQCFLFPGIHWPFLHGRDLHLPLASLCRQSAGVGHVNFERETDIPLFVLCRNGTVPSFGMELLRIFLGADRTDVAAVGNALRVTGRHGQAALATASDGTVTLNLPGPFSAFTAYPFLEVLRSYDALRSDRPPSVPVGSFRDKIVLVGVVAEGRSQFYDTPVDRRYPSLGLYATFLDNALRQRFLVSSPVWVTGLVAFLFALALGVSVYTFLVPLRWIVVSGAIVAMLAICFLLFVIWAVNLPFTPLILAGAISGIAAQVLRHRETREQVDMLQEEKKSVLGQLHDREAKVAVLERELLNVQEARSSDRTAGLLEEIRNYKAEIRILTSRADDMEPYQESPGESRGEEGNFEGILYHTDGPMSPVIEFVRKIAGSEASVLILGESGTGKELVARAIHRRSKRGSGPFVAVNCGALSEGLLESELFGHEKGSFTGAVKDRLGRFELAQGGTIFLDEIGEVSEAFQVKLLRVLQEGEFERVGGTATIRVNVRVLAATNKDLKGRVTAGRFREDLYYRLNVLTVSLPPLRERSADVPILVRHFLRGEGESLTMSRNVMEALQGFTWRGNIRELESVVTRAVLLAKADRRTMIVMKDLTEEVTSAARRAVAVEDQILESLREKMFSRNSISETAEELGGLNRGTVAEYLRGECLKAFVENGYDQEKTIRHLALSGDRAVLDRVSKKMEEYLKNLAEAIDRSQTWEIARTGLRPKTKNLPQRYHPFLAAVAEAFYRGIWDLHSQRR